MPSTFWKKFGIISKMIWGDKMKQQTVLKLSMALIVIASIINLYVYQMSRLDSPIFFTHRYDKVWNNAIWEEISLYYITNVGSEDQIEKITFLGENKEQSMQAEGLQEMVSKRYGMYEIRRVKAMCVVRNQTILSKSIEFQTKEGKKGEVNIGHIHFRTMSPEHQGYPCNVCDVSIKRGQSDGKEYYQIVANEGVTFTYMEPTLSPIQLQLCTETGECIQFPLTLQKGETLKCYLDLQFPPDEKNRHTTIFEVEPRLIGTTEDGKQVKQDFHGVVQRITNYRVPDIYNILEEKGAL